MPVIVVSSVQVETTDHQIVPEDVSAKKVNGNQCKYYHHHLLHEDNSNPAAKIGTFTTDKTAMLPIVFLFRLV